MTWEAQTPLPGPGPRPRADGHVAAVELAATRPHSRPQPDGRVLRHASLHLLARRLCAADSERPRPDRGCVALRCMLPHCSKFVAQIYPKSAHRHTHKHRLLFKVHTAIVIGPLLHNEAELTSASIPLSLSPPRPGRSLSSWHDSHILSKSNLTRSRHHGQTILSSIIDARVWVQLEVDVELGVKVLSGPGHGRCSQLRRHESAMDRSVREGGGIPVLHACAGPSSAPSLRLRTCPKPLDTAAAAAAAEAEAAASASAINLPGYSYCTHHQQPTISYSMSIPTGTTGTHRLYHPGAC